MKYQTGIKALFSGALACALLFNYGCGGGSSNITGGTGSPITTPTRAIDIAGRAMMNATTRAARSRAADNSETPFEGDSPIPNANAQCLALVGGTQTLLGATRTNSEGFFTFNNITPPANAVVIIQVVYNGQIISRIVPISPDPNVSLRVDLSTTLTTAYILEKLAEAGANLDTDALAKTVLAKVDALRTSGELVAVNLTENPTQAQSHTGGKAQIDGIIAREIQPGAYLAKSGANVNALVKDDKTFKIAATLAVGDTIIPHIFEGKIERGGIHITDGAWKAVGLIVGEEFIVTVTTPNGTEYKNVMVLAAANSAAGAYEGVSLPASDITGEHAKETIAFETADNTMTVIAYPHDPAKRDDTGEYGVSTAQISADGSAVLTPVLEPVTPPASPATGSLDLDVRSARKRSKGQYMVQSLTAKGDTMFASVNLQLDMSNSLFTDAPGFLPGIQSEFGGILNSLTMFNGSAAFEEKSVMAGALNIVASTVAHYVNNGLIQLSPTGEMIIVEAETTRKSRSILAGVQADFEALVGQAAQAQHTLMSGGKLSLGIQSSDTNAPFNHDAIYLPSASMPNVKSTLMTRYRPNNPK